MTVQNIIDSLDSSFHFSSQDSWDNSGLLVGNPDAAVTSVLLAVDITESVVDEAIQLGCNVVIAHHPIMFRGIKRLTYANAEQRIIAKSIKNDINLIAVHTPLDKTPKKGSSAALGEYLGVKKMKVLIPERHPFGEWGYGIIGELDYQMGCRNFMSYVAEKLDCKTISHNGICDGDIKRVAICTGSSVEFASQAEEQGADVYITADVKYHQMALSEKMLIMDIGHFESEKITINIFLRELQEKFPNFAFRISRASENIIKYYINTDGK